MVSQEALTRLLIEKGIFTKEEFLEMEMVKAVDRELKRKQQRKPNQPRDTLGLGRLFSSLPQGWHVFKGRAEENNADEIIERPWILSWCKRSPDRRYLSCLADVHPLIEGQLFYCQSILLCKLLHLNDGCKSLQVLYSQCTFLIVIIAFTDQEINPKGGEPDNARGQGSKSGTTIT
jgi:hypothetical protein